MAEKLEDCASNQDTLPTGSISFGRFETETLSWERRSSFSHNKYLEEVEKCSTHGSVTQKKAYFEAHFKKKGLMPQISIGSQNGADFQSTNSGTRTQLNEFDELADHPDDGSIQFSYDDESHSLPEEQGVTNYKKEDISSNGIKPTVEGRSDSGETGPFDCSNQDCGEGETQYGNDNIPACEETTVTTVEGRSDSGGNFAAEVPNKTASSLRKSANLQKNTPRLKKTGASTVGKESGAQRVTNGKLKIRSTSSSISGKVPIVGKLPREITRARKPERQSFGRNTQSSADAKSHKSKDWENLKAHGKRVSKSSKGLNEQKGGAVSQPTEKCENEIKDTPRRHQQVNKATMEEVQQNIKTFYFKSNERDEKRKEFNMKLEEKLHTKEVEMNELQAKNQEETGAEIKQLRKSLKFKAMPIPSFYREALPRPANGRKLAAAAPAKSSKLQGKRPPNKEKSPACSNNTDQAPLSREKISVADSGLLVDGSKLEKSNESRASEYGEKTRKKSEVSKKIQQPQIHSRKKGEQVNKGHNGLPKAVRGIVGGIVHVHVAS